MLHPAKPSPPRLFSTSRLTIGILLGSLVQIRPLSGHDVRYTVGNDIDDGMPVEAGKKNLTDSLADLHPTFLQLKAELDANGQRRHEMPTDRREGPVDLEAVDTRHLVPGTEKRQKRSVPTRGCCPLASASFRFEL